MFNYSSTILVVTMAWSFGTQAQSDANTASISQKGDKGEITIMQADASEQNEVLVEQQAQSIGSTVKIEQSLVEQSNVHVSQTGVSQSADILQRGGVKQAEVEVQMSGHDNITDIKQVVEVVNSQAWVDQKGGFNEANIHQSDLQMSIVSVLQSGDNNIVQVQNQASSHASAFISQDGYGNEVELKQLQSDHIMASVSQLGEENVTRILQNTQKKDGIYNDTTRASVLQQGAFSTFVLEQKDVDNNVNVLQSGEDGKLEILQQGSEVGMGNAASVTQTGLNTITSLIQNGQINHAFLKQGGELNLQRLSQVGDNNEIFVEQTAQSVNSKVEVQQQGTALFASVTQDLGEANSIDIKQLGINNRIENYWIPSALGLVNNGGNFNMLNAIQSGENNLMQGSASGHETRVTLQQFGKDNKMGAMVDGIMNEVNAYQFGDRLSATMMVHGDASVDHNLVRLAQSGMLNQADLSINGRYNVVNITQGPVQMPQ